MSVTTKSLPFVLLCSTIAGAATLEVGPGETYPTIQAAIDAASPGDVIEVAPGNYPENLTIGKSPLHLKGARSGVSARGRVSGAPNPAVESVVAPATGSAAVLTSSAGTIVIDGFSFASPAPSLKGVVMVEGADAPGLSFSNNHLRVAAGAVGSALWLSGNAENATIGGNVFRAAAGSSHAVYLNGAASFDGLHFTGNDAVRDGAVAGAGFFVDGSGNVGPSLLRPPRISGNRFAGHIVGLNGGSRSLEQAEVSFNDFDNNTGGMAAGPLNSLIKGNHFTGNSGYGLRLTSFGDVSDASRGARGNLIEGNDFENNGTTVSPAGHGDLLIDDQADANLSGNRATRNRFESAVGVFQNEIAGAFDARENYWGHPDGPVAGAAIAGSGAVDFKPWFADEELTTLDYGGAPLNGEVELTEGESIESDTLSLAPAARLTVRRGASLEVGNLTLQAGSRLEIHGGSADLGKLTAQAGAVIDVVDGELALDPLGSGQSHVMAGSFTFFNCLGSLQINANTSFSGSTLGIASDIHVAPGVTLIVLGSLAFDGCRIDSTGTFNLLANVGSTLRMTRCDVTGAFMTLVGNDVVMRDNAFRDTDVTVFSTVNGGQIFHNIFEDGVEVLNILPGAVVTTQVEGWGNVVSADDVQNRLSLAFRTPVNPTRTLDSSGNLYVQPGDPVAAGLNIGDLVDKAQAVEALVGYHTDYLEAGVLSPSSSWSNGLYQSSDDSAVIGRFNTAVGLGFSHPDRDGSLLDAEVADVVWTAKSLEGLSRVFFREKALLDEPLADTRITASSAGVPYFREYPFTANSANLIVDGTVPEFGSVATAVQTRNSLPLDVLQSGVVTWQGTVRVTFDARDILAGIGDGDAGAQFVGTATTIHGSFVSATEVDIGGEAYTRYVFDVLVDSSVPNGTYNVNGLAMDRSGNLGVLPIGAVEIQKNRIQATVATQGLVATPLTRNVVFTATSSTGSVLATWTVPVNFSGGSGTATLEGVPDGTVNLSAKTAWNLRRRLPAGLDANGQASVSFTGSSLLRGGDLNGNNIVNAGDYNILSLAFPGVNPVADITGNGVVNGGDYNIFSLNWLSAGDPL